MKSLFSHAKNSLKTVGLTMVSPVKNSVSTPALVTVLGTLTATLISFGFSTKSSIAQTIYPFNETFELEEVLTPIPGTDLFEARVSGYSPNAQYGLTNYSVTSYVRADIDAGVVTFNTDPTQFGLEGFPRGSVLYSGSGDDRLFGSSSGTAILDFTTGIISGSSNDVIVGGTGRFSGATGMLNVFESEPIPEDPTTTVLTAQASITGSFQTPQQVPEPVANTTLVGIGLIGTAFLLRQRQLKSLS